MPPPVFNPSSGTISQFFGRGFVRWTNDALAAKTPEELFSRFTRIQSMQLPYIQARYAKDLRAVRKALEFQNVGPIQALFRRLRDDRPLHHFLAAHPFLMTPLQIDFDEKEMDGTTNPTADRRASAYQSVPPNAIQALWEMASPRPLDLWYFVGAREKANVVRQAERYPWARFVSCDIYNQSTFCLEPRRMQKSSVLANLPPNASLHVISRWPVAMETTNIHVTVVPNKMHGWTDVELLHVFAPDEILERRASVVALIYPSVLMGGASKLFNLSLSPEKKELLDPLFVLLAHALTVVQPGGLVFLFTEHQVALQAILENLEGGRDSRIASAVYSPLPMDRTRLDSLGISSHQPYHFEILPMGANDTTPFQTYDPFTWAFAAAFRRA